MVTPTKNKSRTVIVHYIPPSDGITSTRATFRYKSRLSDNAELGAVNNGRFNNSCRRSNPHDTSGPYNTRSRIRHIAYCNPIRSTFPKIRGTSLYGNKHPPPTYQISATIYASLSSTTRPKSINCILFPLALPAQFNIYSEN